MPAAYSAILPRQNKLSTDNCLALQPRRGELAGGGGESLHRSSDPRYVYLEKSKLPMEHILPYRALLFAECKIQWLHDVLTPSQLSPNRERTSQGHRQMLRLHGLVQFRGADSTRPPAGVLAGGRIRGEERANTTKPNKRPRERTERKKTGKSAGRELDLELVSTRRDTFPTSSVRAKTRGREDGEPRKETNEPTNHQM